MWLLMVLAADAKECPAGELGLPVLSASPERSYRIRINHGEGPADGVATRREDGTIQVSGDCEEIKERWTASLRYTVSAVEAVLEHLDRFNDHVAPGCREKGQCPIQPGTLSLTVRLEDGEGCEPYGYWNNLQKRGVVGVCRGSTSVDLVGHEISHVLMQRAALHKNALPLKGESKALRESLSDLLGQGAQCGLLQESIGPSCSWGFPDGEGMEDVPLVRDLAEPLKNHPRSVAELDKACPADDAHCRSIVPSLTAVQVIESSLHASKMYAFVPWLITGGAQIKSPVGYASWCKLWTEKRWPDRESVVAACQETGILPPPAVGPVEP